MVFSAFNVTPHNLTEFAEKIVVSYVKMLYNI